MALATLAGFAVVEATLCLPRVGAWHADLLVDVEAPPSGAVTLQVGDSLDLAGTVDRALPYRGMSQMRIVAGANGLRLPAMPKFYKVAKLGDVLRDLAANAGEKVSGASDAKALATRLPFWATMAAPVGVMVAALVQGAVAGTAWRMLTGGALWVGTETWPDSGLTEWTEISEDGVNRAVEIGSDQPTLVPGTTLGERRVEYVETTIRQDLVRTIAWTVSP